MAMLPWQDSRTCTSEPKDLYPHVLDFCGSIASTQAPVYLPIEAAAGDRPVECLSNVQRRVANSGGEVVTGWAIWEWRGVMIEAEFHTVWRDAGGTLHDVTPRPEHVRRILFLPDPTLKDTGGQVNNSRRALVDDARVQEFIEMSDATFEVMNRGDRAKELGRIEISAEEARELDAIEQRKSAIGRKILMSTPGRNDLCRCGSAKKWKRCHGAPR